MSAAPPRPQYAGAAQRQREDIAACANLVFDFGAVLFRWQPQDLVAVHFGPRAASAHDAAQLAQAIFHHPDWQRYDQGGCDEADVLARTCARLSLLPTAMQALLDAIDDHLAPLAATVALLDELRQRRDQHGALRLFYLSNMPVRYARELRSRHAFLQWFDGGVFSGEVQLAKPQAPIYQLLQQRHQLVPQHTTLIDDMQANVDAARAQGWHAIRFERAEQLRLDLGELLARSPTIRG